MSNRIKLTDKPTKDCFALFRERGVKRCACLRRRSEITCGTKKCCFYKPVGCRDWLRIEKEGEVWLIPPEEYYVK